MRAFGQFEEIASAARGRQAGVVVGRVVRKNSHGEESTGALGPPLSWEPTSLLFLSTTKNQKSAELEL